MDARTTRTCTAALYAGSRCLPSRADCDPRMYRQITPTDQLRSVARHGYDGLVSCANRNMERQMQRQVREGQEGGGNQPTRIHSVEWNSITISMSVVLGKMGDMG